MNTLVRAALCLGVLAVAACRPTEPAPPTPAAEAGAGIASAWHEAGRKIYNFRCYYCHGYSGDAQTLAARFITPPPRSFQQTDPTQLARLSMLETVRDGRAGTAMAAFGMTLNEREIEAVVDFVREEFMTRKALNTRYHTAENGWPDHSRYAAAFPFATGAIALDGPWDELDETQVTGKRLYLSACISCHDRSQVTELGEPWALRGVSYPPGNYEEGDEHHKGPGAHEKDEGDPYELHEEPPQLAGLTAQEKTGERLFQANCAHCHAADGTGRNWIGSFLQPPPPDFKANDMAPRLTHAFVLAVTRDGLPGTSMPAWKDVMPAREVAAVAAYVERAWGPRADSPVRTAEQGVR